MDQIAILATLLMSDPLRSKVLELVAALDLPDCWIGAGFVRDALWDDLHGYNVAAITGDVDVIWYDGASPEADFDRRVERELRGAMPELQWSVKNQARMHVRNDDAPYGSVAHAMRHWPETATAIAARLGRTGAIEVNAPFGVADLFEMKLRPTPNFLSDKFPIFINRVSRKGWLKRYPQVLLCDAYQ